MRIALLLLALAMVEPVWAQPAAPANDFTPQEIATGSCWIDAATGKPVRTGPPGWDPILSPDQVSYGGHNWARVPCPSPSSQTAQPPPPPPVKLNALDQRILDLHNAERVVVGAPPLQWNPQLERDATAYAQQLARTGQLVHAPRDGRGIERENLSQGLLGWGPDQLIRNWVSEKRYFHPGTFPNVCTGDWPQCAHYTQIIWPTTTYLGCGMATGSGYEWLVCRYSPGGNKDGEPVGRPVSGVPERGR